MKLSDEMWRSMAMDLDEIRQGCTFSDDRKAHDEAFKNPAVVKRVSDWDETFGECGASKAGASPAPHMELTWAWFDDLYFSGYYFCGQKSNLLGEARDSERLRMLEEILDKVTPQSLRTFIHAKNSSAGETLRLLRFFLDLLSVKNSSSLSQSADLKNLRYCIHQVVYQILLEKLFAHFISSATVVLRLLEYLMGYIERGGWATYSDTSWEFQATYVSIELLLAAYFWFKFRARAGSGTPSVSDRNKRNKFEPRLKACLRPGEKARDVWLGEYATLQEAGDAYWIGAFYYDRLDRFNDEVLSWCKNNLPPVLPDLSVEKKALWVRGQVGDYLTRTQQVERAVALDPHLGVVEEPHPGVAVEQNQAGGHGVLVVSGTGEGGNLAPIDDIWQRSPQYWLSPRSDWPNTEFIQPTDEYDGPHHSNFFPPIVEQRDFENINGDHYSRGASSTLGDVYGHGVGSEGQTLLRTGWDQSVYNQQDIQHLQQSHGSAFVLEGGGGVPEGGAVLQQEETEERPVPRAFVDQAQAMDLRNVAHEVEELKITKRMRSTFQELGGQGWDLKMEPCVSTELSVAFSKCEGRKRPKIKITGTNCLAFQEIHEQGFKITLEPLANASPQVTSALCGLPRN